MKWKVPLANAPRLQRGVCTFRPQPQRAVRDLSLCSVGVGKHSRRREKGLCLMNVVLV
jgi:hypothetical protein